MSFVGGGTDCSVGGNAVSQFNKHTQQDRSLQRQSAQPGAVPQAQNFKNESMMNARDRQNMEQFYNNNGGPSFQFQPMRHEINRIARLSAGPTQSPGNGWTSEFAHDLKHSQSPVPRNASPQTLGRTTNNNWASEFRPDHMADGMVANHGPQPYLMNQGYQSYRPMMGLMGMGMGLMAMGLTMGMQRDVPMEQQAQNQAPDVDWDNQFKEIEELTSKVEEKQEAKEGQADDIIIDDKYQATFQEVWDNLNLESMENDFITQQYEEFKDSQRETLPADMSQWERDFAKYASTRAHFGDYKFEDEDQNQFLNMKDAYEIGLELMENGAKLSEAALAFEAAIQQDKSHIGAWLKLGEVQTQNEKEIAGIAALEKCLELNPENSEALMTLAISYINEGYDNAAFATLERWISTKYPNVAEQARQQNPSINDEDRFSLNKRVTDLFMKAAQLSPDTASMDPDVQMGLGVLFYANEDFDKTIDCFKAALSIKPDDPILWNRLGASLANSNRSEEAVNAYFKALELKPTFVRARYNLGVSCINIGCYKEAAEHLLSGISMHQVEGTGSLSHNQSSPLTETLKRAFLAMDRRDLLEKVKPGMDLSIFREEFNF